MLRHRRILLIVTLFIVVGSITTTLGYALRIRSDGYRRQLESRLSNRLGLRLSIGSVEPLSLTARRLNELRCWLIQRDTEVFRCDRAVWNRTSELDDDSYTLSLTDGWLLIGANEWSRSEYESMLRGGFGHDFTSLRVRRVLLQGFNLTWTHPEFELTTEDTHGTILFTSDGVGEASMQTHRLNDVSVTSPIHISTRFTPGKRLEFHDFELSVPEVPLPALRLDTLLGTTVTRGRFEGSIRYFNQIDQAVFDVTGAIRDASLAELTAPVTGGPFDGDVDIVIDSAEFCESALTSLRFEGQIGQLRVEQVGRALGQAGLEGNIDLRVHRADYQDGRLAYVSLEGRATGIGLGALTRWVGRGHVSGTLNAAIHNLLIVDDRLVAAAATIDAVPPPGESGTLDRQILQTASQQLLGFDATTFLPPSLEHVEYTRLGVRLEYNDGELRVRGTHGSQNRTILTVRIFGQEFGVIKEPKRTFAVDDPVMLLRREMTRYDIEQLREWWSHRQGLAPERRED